MQITISAHVTLEEIYEWLTPFAERIPLYFALEKYFPKSKIVALARWDQFIPQTRKLKANELWIDIVPIPTMRGKIDGRYKNRQRFSVNPPDMTKSGLREAWFGTVATSERQLKVWRAVIRTVRKHTTGGMWIWNHIHKAKAFSTRLRYSKIVAARHAQGLSLLPFAGGNEVFIEEPG